MQTPAIDYDFQFATTVMTLFVSKVHRLSTRSREHIFHGDIAVQYWRNLHCNNGSDIKYCSVTYMLKITWHYLKSNTEFLILWPTFLPYTTKNKLTWFTWLLFVWELKLYMKKSKQTILLNSHFLSAEQMTSLNIMEITTYTISQEHKYPTPPYL